jgi:glycosyltransferase involved in cell wall biosynthesis
MNYKKVLILGPNKNGGVKEVNDSLELGMKKLDLDVVYISRFKDVIVFIIVNFKDRNAILCLSSLWFGIFSVFFRYSIFIIHGYPYRRYLSWYKFQLNIIGHKLFSFLNKKTVAVSYLTKYVWENFLGLNIDEVIHNPVSISIGNFKQNEQDENSIVFLGRLVKSKNLELILKAIDFCRNELHHKVTFNIVGDGPERLNLQSIYVNSDNHFHGYVSESEKINILSNSKIFISLNEGEPFGLTTLEARAYNLTCILPVIGGHIEYVSLERVILINDINSIDEIASSISKALSLANNNNLSLEELDMLLPEMVAYKYFNLIK